MSVIDRFLVFDIETIPDPNIIAGLSEKARAAKVPPPIGNRIVAISYLSGHLENTSGMIRLITEKVGSLGDEESPETTLLQEFWRGMETRHLTVITWNGRGFDVPVILHRSFALGLSAAPWYAASTNRYQGYNYRYGDNHLDLMDAMADYGAVRNYSLDLIASAVGFPGKIGGHGSEVQGMFERSELGKIRAYCECDCLNLFGVYVRWALLTGKTDQAGERESLAGLDSYLSEHESGNPHFAEFKRQWKATARGPFEVLGAA